MASSNELASKLNNDLVFGGLAATLPPLLLRAVIMLLQKAWDELGTNIQEQRQGDCWNATAPANAQTVRVLGEKHSGTKWLKTLVVDRFCHVALDDTGWTHQMVDETFRQETESVIVVVRNPYWYLASMFERPYSGNCRTGGYKCNSSETLHRFLAKEWDGTLKEKLHVDSNIWTSEPFKNIVDLRNQKNRGYFRMLAADRTDNGSVSHVAIVTYESLLRDTNATMHAIGRRLGFTVRQGSDIVRADPYFSANRIRKRWNPLQNMFAQTPVLWDREYWQVYMMRQEYLKIFTPEHFATINSWLDIDLEKRLGYAFVHEPRPTGGLLEQWAMWVLARRHFIEVFPQYLLAALLFFLAWCGRKHFFQMIVAGTYIIFSA